MNEKYVLIKPYEHRSGTIPEGTEIINFRGAFYMNGGMIPSIYNPVMEAIISDPNYVRKLTVNKNEF